MLDLALMLFFKIDNKTMIEKKLNFSCFEAAMISKKFELSNLSKLFFSFPTLKLVLLFLLLNICVTEPLLVW